MTDSGSHEDATSALAVDFSVVARALFSAGSVSDTLTEVADLATATIEGCDLAGIFLFEADLITTAAQTDPVVAEIDALQQRCEEGPCLAATAQRVIFYAEDLGDDPRWLRFGPAAAAIGVRSVLALPLLGDGSLGALNLYARFPQAFGAVDRARGVLLATLAGLAVSAAMTHEDEERRAANLHAALASREVIGQAQGILMERERIGADQAFDILRRASQHLNVKLREVVQALIDTGETPDAGARRASPMVRTRHSAPGRMET
jgi:hypothetical protein